MNIFNTYFDLIGIICIPLITAIFAFALPLLLQTAARIDDKYSSTILVKIFRKDRLCRFFLYSMLIALSMIIIWACQFESMIDIYIINNSALILLAISSIVLISSTIGVIWLTYIYYVPELLLKRLVKQYKNCKNNQEHKLYFESISKILFYSISKADEDLSRSLLQFYFDTFVSYRKGKENIKITYPDEFYNAIFEANELLCKRERKTVSLFNDSTLYELFIDEYQHTIISDKTFYLIWMCHFQSLLYSKEGFIMSYWKKAHQYLNLFLAPIQNKYDVKWQVTNQDEVNKRAQERERFLEFHYALGGLLLFREKYDLMKQISLWTNQTPPKYVLVPETMEEVITRFMDVSKKGSYTNPVYYEQKYPFPDVSGVNADGIIQMWIKRYVAILFLRQYTLHEYFIYSHTLEMPNIPETQSEKNRWKDELDTLKYFIDDYLSQKDVLMQLGLGELSNPNWFVENNKSCPDDIIDAYRQKIAADIEQIKQTQDIDENKKKEFHEATKNIISNVYKDYAELFATNINNDYNHLFFGGRYQLMDKAAFANNQEISYANSDTIVAETVSLELKRDMLNVFLLMNKSQYLFKEQEVFKAIDALFLSQDIFSIIAIGINLDYFKTIEDKLERIDGKWSYNGIHIIEIWNTMNEFFAQSFIIIRTADLPCVVHNDISKETKQKFGLENVDAGNKTYASIMDLNKEDFSKVKDEIQKSTNVQDLSKSVLVCVDINTEVRCKKTSKCVQLKIFNQFDDRGMPNTISDIHNIWIGD